MSIFGERGHFFSTIIREVYLIKDIKNEGTPFVGELRTYPLIDTPHLFLHYHKKGVFWRVLYDIIVKVLVILENNSEK